MNMFCFQCQETARGQGCTVRGVCGKTEDVANLQDLIYVLKGILCLRREAKKFGIQDEKVGTFITRGLFSTITNVSFDPEDFVAKIKEAFAVKGKKLSRNCLKPIRQRQVKYTISHCLMSAPGIVKISMNFMPKELPSVSFPLKMTC